MQTIAIRLPASAWTDVEVGAQALLDRWLVAEGASVAAGEPVARAILVKAAIDIAAPAAGTLRHIGVPAGESFGRDQVLAELQTA